jgi:NitT/TauT family transport system permease protein
VAAAATTVSAAGRRKSTWPRTFAGPVISFILLLGLWEFLARSAGVPSLILPVPSQIIEDMSQNLPRFLEQGLVTGLEALGGFALAVAVGIPLAVAVSRSPGVKNIVYPMLLTSNSIPKIAIAPLFVLWLGYGAESKVLIAFLIAFFPVLINTVAGLNSVPTELVDLGLSSGAGPVRRFFLVVFPYALPEIFSGLKVAISLAVTGAIVGEFVASDAGLGYLILTAQGSFNTVRVFSGIVSLAVLGVVFFYLIELLERVAVPWSVMKRRETAAA